MSKFTSASLKWSMITSLLMLISACSFGESFRDRFLELEGQKTSSTLSSVGTSSAYSAGASI